MDRFDLEAAIMDAWNVVSDLQLGSEWLEETRISPEDYMANLSAIYEVKFLKLMNIFETMVKEYNIK